MDDYEWMTKESQLSLIYNVNLANEVYADFFICYLDNLKIKF